MTPIALHALACRYGNQPCYLAGFADPAAGTLLVAKQKALDEPIPASDHRVIVTDAPEEVTDWQLCFSDAHLAEVIQCWQSLKSAGRLALDKSVNRFDPHSVIQAGDTDERGVRWRFNNAMLENGHIAVLMMCWATVKAHQAHILTHDAVDLDKPGDDVDDTVLPWSTY